MPYVAAFEIALQSGIAYIPCIFAFLGGFGGYFMEEETIAPFSAAGLKGLSPAVSIQGITSQAP